MRIAFVLTVSSLLCGLSAADQLPEYWPDDVPLLGPIEVLSASRTPNVLFVHYMLDKPVAEAYDAYVDLLRKADWKFTYSEQNGKYGDITAEKEQRTFDLTLAPNYGLRDDLSVEISVIDSELPCLDALTDAPSNAAVSAAEEIIQRSKSLYGSATRYYDSGQETRYILSPERHPQLRVILLFETVFEGPERFRFECSTGGNQWVVHRDEGGTSVHSTDSGETRQGDSLATYLANPDYKIGQAPSPIPDILLNKEWKNLRFNGAPRLVGEEEVDGVTCYRIDGFNKQCLPFKLWIGVEDHLIRQIERETRAPGAIFIKTLRVSPTINVSIEEALFEFQPEGRLQTMKIGNPFSAAEAVMDHFGVQYKE